MCEFDITDIYNEVKRFSFEQHFGYLLILGAEGNRWVIVAVQKVLQSF